MSEHQIVFDDGAAYERMMGVWSRAAGETFIDWLSPAQGLRWLDVGCGNGAFTELLSSRSAPARIEGIDPSAAQLEFARGRLAPELAGFTTGSAQALPFADNSFDAATMALVIFFVPEPDKGVAEMTRVVRPGGIIASYAWDLDGGGFPFEPVHAQLGLLGITPAMPPSPGAADIERLQNLWNGAGLKDVETRIIEVTRTYANFDEYWAIAQTVPTMRGILVELGPANQDLLRERLKASLPTGAGGQVTITARAHAVKGVKPG